MLRQCTTMIELCDELTKGGKVLSITWDGGHDSGWFDIKLNDEPIGEENDDLNAIADHVSDKLGYGSFAGEFSTNGELVYNRETKCFEGTDTYSTKETEVLPCAIKISVPVDVWFDHLDLHIEMEQGDKEPNAAATFFISNGPRINMHTSIENEIAQLIKKQMVKILPSIRNFSSLWENLRLPLSNFQQQNKKLEFALNELTYSYDSYEEKQIQIYLSENK